MDLSGPVDPKTTSGFPDGKGVLTFYMIDQYERDINYLRVSVTDRCNLRCTYCMPKEGLSRIGHDDILRYEEIHRIIRVAAGMGITKVRITGGEPLVRRGVAEFIASLRDDPGTEGHQPDDERHPPRRLCGKPLRGGNPADQHQPRFPERRKVRPDHAGRGHPGRSPRESGRSGKPASPRSRSTSWPSRGSTTTRSWTSPV